MPVEEYFGQQCQDEGINKSFRQLHHDIVNMIISWCKEHGVVVDELHLSADSLQDSIENGEWTPVTDSYFALEKFTQEYKDVLSMKKTVSDKEFKLIKLDQKPYIFSA